MCEIATSDEDVWRRLLVTIEESSHEVIMVNLIVMMALGLAVVFSMPRCHCYRYPSITEISLAAAFITGISARIRSFGMNGRVADTEMPATISPLPSRIGAATQADFWFILFHVE